jgi:hypothetical protein
VEDFNHGAIIPPGRSAIIIGINLVKEPKRSESLSGKKIFCKNSLDIRDHVAKDIADGWAEQRNNDHDDYSDQDKN